jgi:putative flippase GtrA
VTHAEAVDDRRSREARKEAIGFIIVGVVNLAVEIGAFNLLRTSAGPVPAKIIGTTVGSISAFFMNKYWTFSHRPSSGVRREFGVFAVAATIAIIINALVVGLARYGLGVQDGPGLNIANLAGIGLATIFRFVAYKFWIFRADEPQAAT